MIGEIVTKGGEGASRLQSKQVSLLPVIFAIDLAVPLSYSSVGARL